MLKPTYDIAWNQNMNQNKNWYNLRASNYAQGLDMAQVVSFGKAQIGPHSNISLFIYVNNHSPLQDLDVQCQGISIHIQLPHIDQPNYPSILPSVKEPCRSPTALGPYYSPTALEPYHS